MGRFLKIKAQTTESIMAAITSATDAITCTFKTLHYESTPDSVSVRLEYTRKRDSWIQEQTWHWEGGHVAALSLGLDNPPGITFSGTDVVVIRGIDTADQGIPTQVCAALEEMAADAARNQANQGNSGTGAPSANAAADADLDMAPTSHVPSDDSKEQTAPPPAAATPVAPPTGWDQH